MKQILFAVTALATLCGLSMSPTTADNSSTSNNIQLVAETKVDADTADSAPGYHCRYKYSSCKYGL